MGSVGSNSYLGEDHGRNLLGRERLGLAEVLDLDLGVATLVNDLERPALGVLLDVGVIEGATDKTPVKDQSVDAPFQIWKRSIERNACGKTYLMSKTVLRGFMAAWFLAASPIRRSFSLKETNEGVVKLPCSLAMISTLLPS